MDIDRPNSRGFLEGITPHSCQFCRKIEVDPSRCFCEGQSGRPFDFSLQEVSDAAKDGCPLFLRQLRRVVHFDVWFGPEETERWSLRIKPFLDRGSAELQFDWITKDGREILPSERRSIFAIAGSKEGLYILSRPLKPKSCLETAKAWLRECKDLHIECDGAEKSRFTGYMPKRTIYVGFADSDSIYVKDMSKEPAGPYAALSYCWGDVARNKLRTTRDTLSERQLGITFSQLPKTIQDAVGTTRGLGLQYLWVDSLCIIQDDEDDKNTEIANMSQIYMSATVTISAARASHCNEGFLHERDLATSYVDVYELPWCGVGKDPAHQTVFCSEGDIRRCKIDPIDTRAWTMQEHELSPRLLRFGTSQMVWKCLHGSKSDGGSNEKPPDSEGVGDEQILDKWRQVVEEYTARCISNPEDRLPAIAAIAEKYGKLLGSGSNDYVAGLWKHGLPYMLLWYIPPGEQGTSYPALLDREDVSPTWSWHLAHSGVRYPPLRLSSHPDSRSLEIEEYKITLATTVKYGRVAKGALVVLGFLQAVCWTGSSFMRTKNGDLDAVASIKVAWDLREVACGEHFNILEVVEDDHAWSYGLVLKAVGEETFRRVGYLTSKPTKNVAVQAEAAKWLRLSSRRRITLI